MTPPHRRTWLVLLVAAAVLIGCGRDRGREEEAAVARTFVPLTWDTLWSVRSATGDTTLLMPRLLAAGTLIHVFDDGRQQVMAFDSTGAVRWRFGARGGGPAEFASVRDLKVGPGGTVAVLDPANRRLTVLDEATGTVRLRVPLGSAGHAEQVAPLADGTFVLLVMDPDRMFAHVDSTGRVLRRFGLPADVPRLHPMARQGYLAADRGSRWVFGFSMGDGWFSTSGPGAVGARRGWVEHTEFPEIESRRDGNSVVEQIATYAPCSACSISLDGDTVHVVFGGYTPERRRVVDRYDVRTGRYAGSLRLPRKPIAHAVHAGTHLLLVDDPEPGILALRPRT